MANMSVMRIKRELEQVLRGDEVLQGMINIELVNDNWRQLRGEIAGPRDTPYEGGKFKLEIQVPDSYPFSPPKVRFTTRVWHPNISTTTGSICRDTLKDNWSAAMTLRTILLSMQALLSVAYLDDPQDVFIARQFETQQNIFQITAKHWTNIYAGGPNALPDCDTKVQYLTDMGINEHEARFILSKASWDLDSATERLFH